MAALQQFKCPCCGGQVEFDSASQQMKCPYCDSEFEIAALQEYNKGLQDEPQDDMSWGDAGGEWGAGETEGIKVYTCQSCGGEIIADETTGATACPYCGNPVVMTHNFSDGLRPDYVIPFKIDKKAVKAKLAEHLKGKILLPKVFKDQNHIDEIKGVYVPFWLYDTEAQGESRYEATKVRRWHDENYNYKETKYYSVMRRGRIGFERIPVDGSSKMADDLMESIEPFDFKDAVEFNTAYLSGYLAEKYDVDDKASAGRANERVKKSTEDALRETVKGYDSVVTKHTAIQLENADAKYALYPVWILNTTWNGRQYVFAMNGQTGKFVGNLPMDKKAFWMWQIICTLICSGLVYIIGMLLQ